MTTQNSSRDRYHKIKSNGTGAQESMTARVSNFDARTVQDAQGTTYVVTASGARIRVANTGSLLGLRRARVDGDGRCFI
jgi:hypothetical protein